AQNERDRGVLAATALFSPSPRWIHQLRATAYHQDFVYSDRSDGVAQPPDFFVFDATFRFASDLWRTGLEYLGIYEARPEAGRSPFALAWGAQWEREDLGNETSGDFSGELELDRSSGAVFGEARATVGEGLYLMAGVRAEQYQDLDTEVTPRASAAYDAVPGRLRLRGAVGRGYKAPNLQEQYVDNPFIVSNPDLDPERSTSWEVGADSYGDAGRLSLSLTWFSQSFEDLIRTVPLEGDTRQINRNLGKSRARGVEWAARWAAEETWAIGTEGAWVDTEVRDNVGLSPAQFPLGESLPGRPDVVGSGYLELAPARRVTAVLRGTYVGKQDVLRERFSGPRVQIEPYLLGSVNLQYALSGRSAVYLRVDNVLDTDYDTAFDRPGAPLTAAVGVRFDAAGGRD
ncbi:MAG TPA: TonB-dependent receptor, partial [Longimicrobiaceae bacterium]|nr:TonB-dependent receptor [Longimicrobiaceae bacterium]